MTTNDPPPYPGDSPGSDDSATGPGDSTTGPGDSTTSGLPSYGSVQPPEGTPPPPPPPPPSAPGGSSDAFSAPDAIGWGWRKFTANVVPIVIAGVVVVGISIAVNVIGGAIAGGGGGAMGFGDSPGSFDLGSAIVSLLASIVQFVLGAAVARTALDVADGQEFDFFGAFGKINIVNVIIASVIVGILTTIGFLLLVIPGIIVIFLTFFTTYFVVDDSNASPVQAVQDSVKLVTSNLGDSLLLALLNILVIIAGVIALCVGIFVAYPVTVFATAYAFRKFRGQPVAA
jgi:uncharacterized membrane protein